MIILDQFKSPMVQVSYGPIMVHIPVRQFSAMVMAAGALSQLALPMAAPLQDDLAETVQNLDPLVQEFLKTKLPINGSNGKAL